jgi:ketosteroid isomerase-like protein
MSEEEELLRLDREWNEAYPRLDSAALGRIIADDWVCVDAAGLRITKRQLLERVSAAESFPPSHEFDETDLRLFGDAAVVTGRLSFDAPDDEGGGLVRARQRYTRVYAKRGGRWQAVATHVTVVKGDG